MLQNFLASAGQPNSGEEGATAAEPRGCARPIGETLACTARFRTPVLADFVLLMIPQRFAGNSQSEFNYKLLYFSSSSVSALIDFLRVRYMQRKYMARGAQVWFLPSQKPLERNSGRSSCLKPRHTTRAPVRLQPFSLSLMQSCTRNELVERMQPRCKNRRTRKLQ